MKFGINGWCWGYPFYEKEKHELSISKASKLGFDGIEVPLEDPKKLDVASLAKTLNSHSLPCSSILPVYDKERDLISSDSLIRRNTIGFAEQSIEIASELGADIVVVLPTAVWKFDTSLSAEEEWELEIRGLREIGDIAAEKDIYVVVEPLNRFETYFINKLSEVVKLVRDVNHPRVRAMMDTFHMNIEDKKFGEEIRKADNLIFHIHMNENDRGPPGFGHIPFPEIFEALKAVNYDRWIVMEPFSQASIGRRPAPDPDVSAHEGLRYLRNLSSTRSAVK